MLIRRSTAFQSAPRLLALASLFACSASAQTNSALDSLLDWGEAAYPELLVSASNTTQSLGYTYRCYAKGTLCLGTRDDEANGQLYIYKEGDGISSLGALSDWRKTADKEKVESARVFPVGLAVSSPTQLGSTNTKSILGFTTPQTRSNHTIRSALSYAAATARISAILAGTHPAAVSFDPNALLSLSKDASCFGPILSYTNHPDGGSGTLPNGDLGIWLETDSVTGDACAAAQLNARLEGSSDRTNSALMTVAVMLRMAISSGIGLPLPAARVDVLAPMNALGVASTTFVKAYISLDSTGKVWTYQLAYSFTDGSGVSHDVALELVHTPGSTPFQYNGLITLSVTDFYIGGNCGSGSNPFTRIDTLKYDRAGTNKLSSVQRSGQFCGKGSYITHGNYEADGQLKASSSWADNFSRFGASYDPATLKGNYIYAWQAGRGDGNSRILQLGLNGIGSGTSNDGETYFGYGNTIDTSNGSIKGFYCNWAGPKPASPIGLHPEYAQRQFIAYDSSTGKWSQPTGGSDIRYAPADTCTYTGSTFWYDRNLSGTNDETASDITVSTPDLMGLSTAATIAEAIAARGYSIPGF